MIRPGTKRILFALGLGLWTVGAAASLDARFPVDLSRYQDRSTIVVDARGEILRAFLTGDDKWRLPVRAEDVDPAYLSALVAFEDRRFWMHRGVDPVAILRAIKQWAEAGRVVSGASTLTMQAARLLEPRDRTLVSKMIEAVRALQLEWHLSKSEILSIYLTLAPFGGNIEGVRAASLAYFGKEPDRLTLAQSALLIALPQSPERRRPDREARAAGDARGHVLRRLQAVGIAAARAVQEAQQEHVPTAARPMPFHAPRLTQRLASSNRGQVIATTLDAALQGQIEEMIAEEARWIDDQSSVAVIVVENATREVKAYLGGADFWRPHGQVDLGQARRSPGSTLKPFIYGLAFDELGVHPDTLIDDRPTIFGDYAPTNFSLAFQGRVTLREALRQSLNIPAVALLNELGPVRLSTALTDAGASLSFGRRNVAPSLPLALGGVGLTLTDLTMLYAGLANGGEMRPLRYLADDPIVPARRVMGATAAWYVTNILRGTPMPPGWAQRFGVKRERAVAFKTGTSYGFRDAWAIGYSGSFTVGVWVGRPDGSARVGHIGLDTAAPLLLRVFEQMPPEQRPFPPRPNGAITVRSTEALPENMRVFATARDGARGFRRMAKERPLVIKFPGDGVTISHSPGEDPPLQFSAVGGRGPLRWIVNGDLLPQRSPFEPAAWLPDSEGFAEAIVIDAEGQRARSVFRVMKGP